MGAAIAAKVCRRDMKMVGISTERSKKKVVDVKTASLGLANPRGSRTWSVFLEMEGGGVGVGVVVDVDVDCV